MALRIVFAGSPAAAVPSLRALAATDHEIVAVVTREDSPLGRKRVLTPTPVADVATQLGIPVLKANRIAPLEARIAALRPDLGVIVAYGGLIREPLLSTPRLGWINLHFSLLPRWRGAAPVQRALIAGDPVTGAAVFQLVAELDAGPVFATLDYAIGRNQTAGHLLDVLAARGADLLVSVVDDLDAGTARAVPQRGEVTLAPKLELDDGRLDWSRPAAELDARIRGTTPEPGAFALLDGDTERLKVLDAAIAHDDAPLAPGEFDLRAGRLLVGTGTDPLHLVTVQPAGKRPMAAADWWRGRTR
ncbi:methionyl-tRNA formyltransferase [Pseudolysinimonas yzui]|uniref:Methionyl-tRNA formyltransferase n=1 Tax=Pseudolysinimonas yzui TaxID=2708254 RepID=A0A8J3GNW7_9MICO|nr:methionyl-tRNA formyltransferase [Pseudolysinimonas yzui]GHF08925.1 methionyl-tRNA formyltransferase [Pseudolysinimonas yzui]